MKRDSMLRAAVGLMLIGGGFIGYYAGSFALGCGIAILGVGFVATMEGATTPGAE